MVWTRRQTPQQESPRFGRISCGHWQQSGLTESHNSATASTAPTGHAGRLNRLVGTGTGLERDLLGLIFFLGKFPFRQTSGVPTGDISLNFGQHIVRKVERHFSAKNQTGKVSDSIGHGPLFLIARDCETEKASGSGLNTSL